MGKIKESVKIFERLRSHKYKITIEDGSEFILTFSAKHYHHLIGFQHLTDLPDISRPPSTTRFYLMLKKGKVSESYISSSTHINKINDRINTFEQLEDIVCPGVSRIIVEFDNTLASSKIVAKYYLFKQVGGLNGAYHMLFIGHSASNNAYYPATYIIEHSPKYIANQTFLNCTIEIV